MSDTSKIRPAAAIQSLYDLNSAAIGLLTISETLLKHNLVDDKVREVFEYSVQRMRACYPDTE